MQRSFMRNYAKKLIVEHGKVRCAAEAPLL